MSAEDFVRFSVNTEDFVRQALLDADLTMVCRRWDPPGREIELHGRCPVCRQSWATCRLGGPCQLIGVMGGYNAALRNSLSRLMMVWPTPCFDTCTCETTGQGFCHVHGVQFLNRRR